MMQDEWAHNSATTTRKWRGTKKMARQQTFGAAIKFWRGTEKMARHISMIQFWRGD
jgi:hypothetical protein